jgi:tRNA G18 (ribose-2'-O)-methylase SpoU
VLKITSKTNSRYQAYLSLNEAKGIKKNNLYLISGEKLVKEAIKQIPHQLEALLFHPKLSIDFPLPQNITPIELSQGLFRSLDDIQTHFPILVANTFPIQEWSADAPQKSELFLCLQDPANLGAALRAAEAFLVDQVILLKECANPFHPKAMRAASGSLWRIPLLKGPSIDKLVLSDLITLNLKGTSLIDFKWPKNFKLLLGMEGPGIPANLLKKSCPVHIPIKSGMDSLNAVSALSVALYDYQLKLR